MPLNKVAIAVPEIVPDEEEIAHVLGGSSAPIELDAQFPLRMHASARTWLCTDIEIGDEVATAPSFLRVQDPLTELKSGLGE